MKIDHLKWMTKHLKRRQRLRKIGRFIGDFFKLCWYGVRYHYILIISFGFAFYPIYDLIQTGEPSWLVFILCFTIFIFGVNLDMRESYRFLHF
jgi:hypothetical protein